MILMVMQLLLSASPQAMPPRLAWAELCVALQALAQSSPGSSGHKMYLVMRWPLVS